MNALGMRYNKGEGVHKSYQQARFWWGKTSAQGDEYAA